MSSYRIVAVPEAYRHRSPWWIYEEADPDDSPLVECRSKAVAERVVSALRLLDALAEAMRVKREGGGG